MSEREPQAIRDLRAAMETVKRTGYQPSARYLSPAEAVTLDKAGLTARDREAILADRLARVTARAERAEAQVERVRGLAEAARPGNKIQPIDCTKECADEPCNCSGVWRVTSWQVDIPAIRAALAETEAGHQTRPEAPRSVEEAVSRVPGPDGVREAGRRAGAIVDSEGAW